VAPLDLVYVFVFVFCCLEMTPMFFPLWHWTWAEAYYASDMSHHWIPAPYKSTINRNLRPLRRLFSHHCAMVISLVTVTSSLSVLIGITALFPIRFSNSCRPWRHVWSGWGDGIPGVEASSSSGL
jgi:hypothetical protein